MSVVRTIAGTIATKGFGLGAALIVGVILFRTLGPDGKGQVDALVAWAALLVLAYPSLEEPQLYLMGQKKDEPARFFLNGVLAAVLFGLVVYGCLELIIRFFPDWLSYRDRETGIWRDLDRTWLRRLAMMAPLVLAQRAVGGVLQGLKDMKAFNTCFLVQNGCLLSLVVVLVLGVDLGVEGALYGHMASMAAGGLTAIFLCARHPLVRKGPFRPDLPLLRRLVVGGLRIHGGVVAAWVIIMSDQLIVLRYWDVETLAYYVLAVGLTGHLRRLVLQPVKEVLGSRLPEMIEDRERMVDSIARTCRHTILLTLVPGAALGAGGYVLLWVVYGERSLPAYGPLLALLPGSLLWAAAVILSYLFIGTNRFLTLTVIGVFIATTNLVLNFAFVPEHGMMAAALSSTFCYGLHLVVFLVYVRLVDGERPGRFLVPLREDLGVYGDAWRKVRRRLLPGTR